MIIIKLMGGLGNQLQQYALYLKFLSLEKEVYLDTSWFDETNQDGMAAPRRMELGLFKNADYKKCSFGQIEKLVGYDRAVQIVKSGEGRPEKVSKVHSIASKARRKLRLAPDHLYVEHNMYDSEIFELRDAYLEGYWAADRYYSKIWPVIREKISFDIDGMSEANINMACQMLGLDIGKAEYRSILERKEMVHRPHTCSVHIRRGDYLDPENAAIFGGIATEEYYDSAFAYIRKQYPDTQFYIFSDDKEYVEERYGSDPNCHIVDINTGEDSRYDIYLMSCCRMHICANSTFSFWGVRLDPDASISIRPSIHKNSQVFDSKLMHRLWKGWILIDPAGEVK